MDGPMSAFGTAVMPSWDSLRAAGLMLVMLGIGTVLPSKGYAELGNEVDAANAVLFEAIDANLLQALKSADTEERKVNLRAAQASFDKVNVSVEPLVNDGNTSTLSQFEKEIEVSVSQAEVAVRKRLYLSLMRLVWESPYATSPENELESLETVSDALETLHTISELDATNQPGVVRLQSAYFEWLESRRNEIGLDVSAIKEGTGQRVFDQRVVVSDSGKPEIYQLVGTEDKRVNWQAVDGTKIGSTINMVGSLSLELSTVGAPWVIIISGSNLGQYITPHLSWFDELREQSLIILIEREDFASLVQGLPTDLYARRGNPVYMLPGPRSHHQTSDRLTGFRCVGWPILGHRFSLRTFSSNPKGLPD